MYRRKISLWIKCLARILIDRCTGALMDVIRENDLIYIKFIDRLGRNYTEIIEHWKIITKDKKADIYVIEKNC